MSRARIRAASVDRVGRVSTRPHGFTLIELMIAMLLGLIVIAGVVSVFLGTQQSYRANVALGDVQDGSRVAFDMMSRDIRDAGLTGCYSSGVANVANVLNTGPNGTGADWWANWGNTIHGYTPASATTKTADPALTSLSAPQVAGTDSLQLLGASDTSYNIASHTPSTSTFTLNETSSTLAVGDVIMVCDPNHAVITQITKYNPALPVSFSDTTSGVTPGNCSIGLAFPTVCTPSGTAYTYAANSQLARLTAVDWYIGTYTMAGGGSGVSLYRADLENHSGVATVVAQEMVRNVSAMALAYHQAPSATFLPASGITNWAAVDSVQVTLTLQSTFQLASTSMKPISRTFTATSTLRNRVN